MKTIIDKHADMVGRLAKDPLKIISELSARKMHMIHMALGLAGELGEVNTMLDDLNSNQNIHMRKSIRDAAVKELGDFEFYFTGLLQAMDRTRDEIQFSHDYDIAIGKNGLQQYTLELVDIVKKYCINNNEQVIVECDELIKRIHSCLHYIKAQIYSSHEEVLQGNYDKLNERYDGLEYSDKAAAEKVDQQ